MTPANAEGVLGMGSWNAKTSPAPRPTSTRTRKVRQGAGPLGERPLLGRPGDHDSRRWKQVGLDRKALREYIAKNEFKTILGDDPFDRQRERLDSRHRRASGRTASSKWSGPKTAPPRN
jgi:branched-chain amino acid transport system substrate-binding protein